jgi:dynein heavy chain
VEGDLEDNEPENLPIPDFELAINDNKEKGSWLRLLLLRCVSRFARRCARTFWLWGRCDSGCDGVLCVCVSARCMRIDRTLLVVKDFIKNNDAMGDRYTEPVTDTMEMIYGDMTAFVPVIFLLSAGADPTDNIEQLAKKKKQSVQCVSLGQGQVRRLSALVQCRVVQCRVVLPWCVTASLADTERVRGCIRRSLWR